MNVDGVANNSAGASSATTKAEKDRTELGQSDFLKLMTTQLRNQDPMNPMKNGEFMAQMAQFTSASGIQELQASFSEFQSSMAGNQALEAANLVGRKVVVDANAGRLPPEGSLEGTVRLDSSVGNLTVSIMDDSGQRVGEVALGSQTAGPVDFSWDGRNADGERMPSGTYQVVAQSQTADGVDTHPVQVSGAVTSVALGANGRAPQLSVDGLGEIALTDVRRVLGNTQ